MKKMRPTCRDPTTLAPKKNGGKRSFSPWRGRCVIRPIHNLKKSLKIKALKFFFRLMKMAFHQTEMRCKIYGS